MTKAKEVRTIFETETLLASTEGLLLGTIPAAQNYWGQVSSVPSGGYAYGHVPGQAQVKCQNTEIYVFFTYWALTYLALRRDIQVSEKSNALKGLVYF